LLTITTSQSHENYVPLVPRSGYSCGNTKWIRNSSLSTR
jgi:hypothetical protein